MNNSHLLDWNFDSYEMEYNRMFRDPQSRHNGKHEEVMAKCKQIYDDLMEKNQDGELAEYAEYAMSIRKDDNSVCIVRFMSTQPYSKDLQPQKIIDHVTKADCNDSLIFGFCSKLDMKKTLYELKKKWRPPYPPVAQKSLILYLRSNMNKYDYTD